MKAALAMLLLASPAVACDWTVVSDKLDSMTDQRICHIRSESAKIGVMVRADAVSFVSGSAYSRDGLTLLIDDNEALLVANRSAFAWQNTKAAVDQIQTGTRLRTSFLDYPSSQEGDAEICTLPELIRSCQAR